MGRSSSDTYKPSKILIIYGYTGSTAETYAKENSITFVSLGQATSQPASSTGVVRRIEDIYELTSIYGLEIVLKAANVNGDSEIDSKDAVLILKYYANTLVS